AFRCTGIHPCADQIDLVLRQCARVRQRVVFLIGRPWRHETGFGGRLHFVAPVISVHKVDQIEMAWTIGAMARRAVAVDDARDIIAPRGCLRQRTPVPDQQERQEKRYRDLVHLGWISLLFDQASTSSFSSIDPFTRMPVMPGLISLMFN